MHPAYRADIDGLRAFAVLSVLIYHLNNSWLLGGFVGVDIFFVISGYLITTIIYKEVQSSSFSFANFYARRVRRIFPALFAMLIVAAAIAIIVLPREEYLSFFKDLKFASAQISNFRFARDIEYMEVGAEASPLLHTWSLAVEEQFYLVWPLLIVGVLSFAKPKVLKIFMVAVAVISLILCEYFLTHNNFKQAFYMFYSRAYELIIGAIIALGMLPKLKNKTQAHAVSTLGFVLLVGSVLCVRGDNFPGVMSVFPALGAAFIIYAGREGWFNKLLSLKAVVWVGLISYSLYLWHWPLIAFTTNVTGESLTNVQAAIIAALSFVFAYLSWRYVEKPFRKPLSTGTKGFWLPPRKTLLKGFFAIVLMVVAGNYVKTHSNVFGRSFQDERLIKAFAKPSFNYMNCIKENKPHEDRDDLAKVLACIFTPEVPEVLLVGDSHSQAIDPLIKAWAEQQGLSYRGIGVSGNPMYFAKYETTEPEEVDAEWIRTSEKLMKELQGYIEQGGIKYLFIANRYDYALMHRLFRVEGMEDAPLENILQHLLKENIKVAGGFDKTQVIMLGQAPVLEEGPSVCLQRIDKIPLYRWFGSETECPAIVEHMQADEIQAVSAFMKKQMALTTNVHLFDLYPLFPKVFNDEGLVLYRDDDHLSVYGALEVLPELTEFMKDK